MRTQSEILATMKDAYVNDSVVRERYGITGTVTFDDVFAQVSIESIIFYIVSVAIYFTEQLFDLHMTDVEAREDQMRVGTIAWWINLCRSFQYGDDLVYNTETNLYEYEEIDETAKIIKFATVREGSAGLQLLVCAADGDGLPEKLEDPGAQRDAFDAYIRKVKLAGLPLVWGSYNADQVKITLTVVRNPMLLDASGVVIGGSAKPVNEALQAYISSLAFGDGIINKTKIIDAIQAATGVIDVYPASDTWLQVSTDETPAFTAVTSQNLSSFGGSFILQDTNITITYTV